MSRTTGPRIRPVPYINRIHTIMPRLATAFLGLALVLLAAPAMAQVQDVTVRQLNALSQDNIDALNALGANPDPDDIAALVTNDFVENETQVRFTAVVLSDPRYSGVRTPNGGVPGSLHFFVRDTAAETEGVEGMTIQIVDEESVGETLNFIRPGDVIEIEGQVVPFFQAWQVNPIDATSIEIIGTEDLSQDWLQPVTVTTADLNTVVDDTGADPLVQINWDNWNSLNGQFVQIESAVVTNSAQNTGGSERPDWAFSTVGEDARVTAYDLSLRYRNNRCDDPAPADCYPNPPYFTRSSDDPFIAPPTSAVISVQGFIVAQGDDPFGIASPERFAFNIIPITDEDLEILESPPLIAISALTIVPTDDFEVEATVTPGGDTEIASATLNYEFSTGETGSVPMAEAGTDTYTATIPVEASQDGAFVTFSVTAVDGGGLTSTSASSTTRVLADGIDEIADIQLTQGETEGASPFDGITTAMNIQGVVMSDPATSGIVSIQDDEALGPWSGIFVEATEEILALGLTPGDRVTITNATIEEASGNVTTLSVEAADFSVTGGGEPYAYVTTLPTGLLAQDNATAESYEGMAVRFDDVTIVSADAGFGEWSFSSDGTEDNAVLGDDASTSFPGGVDVFTDGQELEFIQGLWSFSFGDFKLLPEDLADAGLSVSAEDGAEPTAAAFASVYPNPFRDAAAVTYTLRDAGTVTLEVFDVAGRKVATLVDGVQPAGPHRAELGAQGLADGLYIVRLRAGDEVITTKIALVK